MTKLEQENFLFNIFWKWVKDHDGNIPKKDDMTLENGYTSSYQYEKFYKTRKWNIILEKMGVTPSVKLWEDYEILFLKNNYSLLSDEDIANKLNRSVGSIIYKRNELGLLRQSIKQEWSEWEIEYLKNNFYMQEQSIIEATLNHRKWETIRAYATKQLKLKRKNKFYKYTLDNGMKICKECNKQYEATSDYFYKDRDGLRSYCKKCWRENWYKNKYGENYKNVYYDLNKHLYDKNNNICDSLPEKIITNWFIDNDIKYIKHPYYKDYLKNEKTMRKFDWVIKNKNKNILVEYFGLWDVYRDNEYLRVYTKKAKKKIKRLYKAGLINNCIFIFPSDLKNKKISDIFANILKN